MQEHMVYFALYYVLGLLIMALFVRFYLRKRKIKKNNQSDRKSPSGFPDSRNHPLIPLIIGMTLWIGQPEIATAEKPSLAELERIAERIITLKEYSPQSSPAGLDNIAAIPSRSLTLDLLTLWRNGDRLPPETRDRLQSAGILFVQEKGSRFVYPDRSEADGLDQYYDIDIFRVHYTLSGTHAVDNLDTDGDGTPDYVELVAAELQTIYTTQIVDFGYHRPPGDGWYNAAADNGGSEDYDVYLRNLPYNYYGYVQSEIWGDGGTGNNEYSSDEHENNAATSYMTLRNNYDHFNYGEQEIIQVTVAHEFFHAIQFGYDAYEAIWMMEATAVWMEEAVYDDINDCYQYMTSWFNDPDIALDTEGGIHWYGSYIFFKYIDEHLGGPATIQRIWSQSITHNSANHNFSHLEISEALQPEQSDFKDALNRMVIANRIMSSDASAGEYAYEEAGQYPVSGPAIYQAMVYSGGGDSLNGFGLDRFAGQYIDISINDPVQIHLKPHMRSKNDLTAHSIIRTTDGNYIIYSGDSMAVDPRIGIDWLSVAVVSQDTTGNNWNYQIILRDHVRSGEEFTLSTVRPNPASREKPAVLYINTNEIKSIQVRVINILGQEVKDVFKGYIDGSLNAVTWNGEMNSGKIAPSGVYFLQVKSDNLEQWKKITWVK